MLNQTELQSAGITRTTTTTSFLPRIFSIAAFFKISIFKQQKSSSAEFMRHQSRSEAPKEQKKRADDSAIMCKLN